MLKSNDATLDSGPCFCDMVRSMQILDWRVWRIIYASPYMTVGAPIDRYSPYATGAVELLADRPCRAVPCRVLQLQIEKLMRMMCAVARAALSLFSRLVGVLHTPTQLAIRGRSRVAPRANGPPVVLLVAALDHGAARGLDVLF